MGSLVLVGSGVGVRGRTAVPGRVTLAAVLSVALSAGCGGDAFSAGSSDGGTTRVEAGAGEAGPGGGDAGSVDAASDGQGPGDAEPAGKIVYVSTATGDDARSGLDTKHPVKTIATGLAKAAALGTGAEVHVCAGNYAESNLALKNDVVLLGSFDCLTWSRTSTYGFPTFDGKNASIVTNAAASVASNATLLVGAGVTSSTVIDGFTFAGAANLNGVSIGIDITGAASPTLKNDQIAGGGGHANGAAWGSIGVRVGGTSSAEIADCLIGGGSGQATSGSVGVLLQSVSSASGGPGPSLHDSVVSGGTGASTGSSANPATVGVVVANSLNANRPLQNLVVTGTDKNGTSGSSVGLLVVGMGGVSATVVGSALEGGSGTAGGSTSAAVDVEAAGGSVSLLADRLYGGSRTAGGSQTVGVQAGAAGTLNVADCEIHAGNAPGGSNAGATGLRLASGTSVNVGETTIYTGSATNSNAIALSGGVTNVTLTGNLLVGGGSASSDVAVVAQNCSGMLASLDHTAFLNFPLVYQCGGANIAPDPGVLAMQLGSTKTAGDLELLTACTGQPWCVVDPSCPSSPPATCVQSLFGSSWTSNDDGVTGLFGAASGPSGTTTPAWTLKAGIPCAVAHGGVSIPGLPTDLLGVMRGSMPSIGAVQYTSQMACQ